MAKQNRVDPSGAILADPARGLLMGNRGGPLHDDAGRIVRAHKSRSWIICRTAFKNRRRQVMQPGRYTELFFLDEATALAAGHRPCFECRRQAAQAFALTMTRGSGQETPQNGSAVLSRLPAPVMDRMLHTDRRQPLEHPDRRIERDALFGLPDGVFVCHGDQYYMIHGGTLIRWSFDGYRALDRAETSAMRNFQRLTPKATIAALRCGYAPGFHPSAEHAAGAGGPAA